MYLINTNKTLVLQPSIVHSLQPGIQDNVTFDIAVIVAYKEKENGTNFATFGWLLIHRTYSLKTMFLLCTLSTNTLPIIPYNRSCKSKSELSGHT